MSFSSLSMCRPIILILTGPIASILHPEPTGRSYCNIYALAFSVEKVFRLRLFEVRNACLLYVTGRCIHLFLGLLGSLRGGPSCTGFGTVALVAT